ncbi:hypothetical protein QL285_098893 [Trifolium repens]|nr:hypothetical protein QL285_098893 [Trifolium repens]
MGAGKKKDLRVSLNAFFSSHHSYSTKTCHGKEKGETSTLGERSTMDSCMLRSGRMNRSEKESIDSLPIGWTVGAMIYFTGEVSGSSPGWPSCAKEKNKRLI